MTTIADEIRNEVEHQYELGWRTVLDIDILTDKILAILNRRLDLDLETMYNRP